MTLPGGGGIFRRRLVALGLVALVLGQSCSAIFWRARFSHLGEPIDAGAPFVKAHLKDGGLFVLRSWLLDKDLHGEGVQYDAQRHIVRRGQLSVPLDQIALVETNRPETVPAGSFAVMGVLGVVTGAIAAFCATNPKACFGSCPTFYLPGAASPVAEGFSASIAKSLEGSDVDALSGAEPKDGVLSLRMTNEALETHVVRGVRLWAVDRPEGGAAFRSKDGFFSATKVREPTACSSMSGDCLDLVRRADEREYRSETDGQDLATREVVELTLPPGAGPRGVVVRARNSLLNTFLFYQALAYMGASASDWISELERGGDAAAEQYKKIGRALGDIEVEVFAEGGWRPIGHFDEVGPIAKDQVVLPLPASTANGPLRVRLVMARGNWKVDQVALAEGLVPARAEPLELASVTRAGQPDPRAFELLRWGGDALIAAPGDAYELAFRVPDGRELFLESRGYYYEWIRKEWLKEEDPEKLVAFLTEPQKTLKTLAPKFKAMEAGMEELFWNSRFHK